MIREDEPRTVVIDGEVQTLPYREAVGLVSRGLAVFAPEKPKRAKKSDLPAESAEADDRDTERTSSPKSD